MVEPFSQNPAIAPDLWRKRLQYRSWHRGCKETDLVLGRYCDAQLERMDAPAMAQFEALLDEDDAEIWAWLTDKTPCPKPEYAPLLQDLKTFSIVE